MRNSICSRRSWKAGSGAMASDLHLIKDGLQMRVRDLCAKLLPNGRQEGRLWVAHNPFIAGDERKPPALKVALSGGAASGAWKDWRNGDKGDVIGLVQFALGLDIKGALAWSRDYLGLKKLTWDERQALKRDVASRQKEEEESERRRREFKLKQAERLFLANTHFAGAAEAHARAYFRARRCPYEDVQNFNRLSLRFASATEWWPGAQWKHEDGRRIKIAEGPRFPAIHAAMRQATGIVTCCHVTFLDPLEAKKAPVDKPKLMFGEALGAAIEVADGGGEPFWAAGAAPRPLIVAEGIETALSLAIAAPEARVWAAGSLAGLGKVPAGLTCVSDITLARDNNWGNARAQAQLNQALDELAHHGKPVVVIVSHVGDDFNDLIAGEEDG